MKRPTVKSELDTLERSWTRGCDPTRGQKAHSRDSSYRLEELPVQVPTGSYADAGKQAEQGRARCRVEMTFVTCFDCIVGILMDALLSVVVKSCA